MEGQQGSPAGAAEVEVTTSAAPAASQLLAELEECYRRYLEDSEALVRKKTGFLHAIRSVLGTNPIKTSGIHQKFYDEVRSAWRPWPRHWKLCRTRLWRTPQFSCCWRSGPGARI